MFVQGHGLRWDAVKGMVEIGADNSFRPANLSGWSTDWAHELAAQHGGHFVDDPMFTGDWNFAGEPKTTSYYPPDRNRPDDPEVPSHMRTLKFVEQNGERYWQLPTGHPDEELWHSDIIRRHNLQRQPPVQLGIKHHTQGVRYLNDPEREADAWKFGALEDYHGIDMQPYNDDDEPGVLLPWEPGHMGKAYINEHGQIRHWRTDQFEAPHHGDVQNALNDDAHAYSYIEPDGKIVSYNPEYKALHQQIADHIGGYVTDRNTWDFTGSAWPDDDEPLHILHGYDMLDPKHFRGTPGVTYDYGVGGWGKGMTTEAGGPIEWHIGPDWGPHHNDIADEHRTFPVKTWVIDPDGNEHVTFDPQHTNDDWRFSAQGYEVIDSDITPEQSYMSEDRNMFTHSPFIIDDNKIYLGPVGTHHADLIRRHIDPNTEMAADAVYKADGYGNINNGLVHVGEIQDSTHDADEVGEAVARHTGVPYEKPDPQEWRFSHEPEVEGPNARSIWWHPTKPAVIGEGPQIHHYQMLDQLGGDWRSAQRDGWRAVYTLDGKTLESTELEQPMLEQAARSLGMKAHPEGSWSFRSHTKTAEKFVYHDGRIYIGPDSGYHHDLQQEAGIDWDEGMPEDYASGVINPDQGVELWHNKHNHELAVEGLRQNGYPDAHYVPGYDFGFKIANNRAIENSESSWQFTQGSWDEEVCHFHFS
jgi:hypothetical protein